MNCDWYTVNSKEKRCRRYRCTNRVVTDHPPERCHANCKGALSLVEAALLAVMLGDLLAWAFKKLGAAKLVGWWTDGNCRCRARQEKINAAQRKLARWCGRVASAPWRWGMEVNRR